MLYLSGHFPCNIVAKKLKQLGSEFQGVLGVQILTLLLTKTAALWKQLNPPDTYFCCFTGLLKGSKAIIYIKLLSKYANVGTISTTYNNKYVHKYASLKSPSGL